MPKSPTDGVFEVPTAAPRRTYMLAPRRVATRLAGIQPMSARLMNSSLAAMGIEVVRTIKRGQGTLQTLGVGSDEATDVIVARLEPERAELLRQTLPPSMMIAEDKALAYGGGPRLLRAAPGLSEFSVMGQVSARKLQFRVLNSRGQPIERVMVQVAGDGYPAQGITSATGEVEVNFLTLSDRPARMLVAAAPHGYWDLCISDPPLSDTNVNIIRLRGLSDTIANFPDQFRFGWGQRAMGLHQVPKELGGAGVKIAIIDSGCDNGHPLLGHVKLGRDFTGARDPNSWSQDPIGHGTHCAGIVAARGHDTHMRGFVPDAEIHVLRIFPGGQYSNLLEALDYCIDHQIDLINMSLGGDAEVNEVIEETLQIAALNGIACVVAAGNSGDPVKYPARSPEVFAVAALGSLHEVQPNTWDATTIRSGLAAADGIFSPTFSCFGPQIAVSAPGVAIISTVPGGGYEPQSGTSMAASHVTGLAALLLAHHPAFQSQFRVRSRERVLALYGMVRSLCMPYRLGDFRTGDGLPRISPVVAMLQAKPEATGHNGKHVPGVAQAAAGAGPFVPFAADPLVFVSPQGFVGGLPTGVLPIGAGPIVAGPYGPRFTNRLFSAPYWIP